MLRQHLVECLVDLQRLVLAGIARSPAAIGFDRAQRVGVELVDLLQPTAGFLLVACKIENQPGMQVLEDRVPLRTGQTIDPLDRALLVLRPVLRPGGDQCRGQVRDRAAHRLRDVLARRLILLRLQGAHAEHQPGDTMGLVELDDALGELDGVVHLAVDQDRQEGTLQQHRVLRIDAQCRAVIGGGRHGVALDTRVARRQIVAGRRIAREFLLGRSRCLSCRLGAQRGRQRDENGERNHTGAPGRDEEIQVDSLHAGGAATRYPRFCTHNGAFESRPQGRRPSTGRAAGTPQQRRKSGTFPRSAHSRESGNPAISLFALGPRFRGDEREVGHIFG